MRKRVASNAIRKRRRIAATLKLDGRGRMQHFHGIRFFDHMLELFAKHGGFDLKLKAEGDLDVDQHHTVEDVGIVLGELVCEGAGRSARESIARDISCCRWMKRWRWWRSIWAAGRRWFIRSREGAAGRRSANRTGGGFLRRIRESTPARTCT